MCVCLSGAIYSYIPNRHAGTLINCRHIFVPTFSLFRATRLLNQTFFFQSNTLHYSCSPNKCSATTNFENFCPEFLYFHLLNKDFAIMHPLFLFNEKRNPPNTIIQANTVNLLEKLSSQHDYSGPHVY